MKVSDNYEVMFVFSEIQAQEEQLIADKSNKKFKMGKLYIGATAKDFTKMIRSEQYSAMRSQYPDVKVIAEGRKADFKFTDPKKEFGD